MRLLINVNSASFLISHRFEVACGARDSGFEVHIAADSDSADEVTTLRSAGFHFHHIRLRRGGRNPIEDLLYLQRIRALVREIRPQVIHNVTVKPVVYGTLAARAAGVPGIVNAVSGLGYSFAGVNSRRFISSLVKGAYRFALKRPGLKIIFQNEDDIEMFVRAGLIDRRQSVLIRGSGVDLDVFSAEEELEGDPVVVMPARMLRDKGVLEFAEAARLLLAEGRNASFILAGKLDRANPAGLRKEELLQLAQRSGVKWVGHVMDMASLYKNSHIVCLPSYREGLPKCLIEACAAGRAIVTTDVPGCRDAVRHFENGILVPPRDSSALAEALKMLLDDARLRKKMGAAGRARAEAEFDVCAVVRDTLGVYESVLGGNS